MANPTHLDIFDADSMEVNSALTQLGFASNPTDARLAAHMIINRLYTAHTDFVAANAPLSTYVITKEADNIDIDTQRQIFTFTFDMAIAATSVENEPA